MAVFLAAAALGDLAALAARAAVARAGAFLTGEAFFGDATGAAFLAFGALTTFLGEAFFGEATLGAAALGVATFGASLGAAVLAAFLAGLAAALALGFSGAGAGAAGAGAAGAFLAAGLATFFGEAAFLGGEAAFTFFGAAFFTTATFFSAAGAGLVTAFLPAETRKDPAAPLAPYTSTKETRKKETLEWSVTCPPGGSSVQGVEDPPRNAHYKTKIAPERRLTLVFLSVSLTTPLFNACFKCMFGTLGSVPTSKVAMMYLRMAWREEPLRSFRASMAATAMSR